jgi:hypothetical protein
LIWSYRAVNNPAARRKWISFVLFLLLAGILFTGFRIYSGAPLGRSIIICSMFILFVILYGMITLGKPRHYYVEEETVYYRPFRTNLKDIEGYEVDEDRMVIRLKKKGLLGVKTLYFENLDDLRQMERFLKRLKSS